MPGRIPFSFIVFSVLLWEDAADDEEVNILVHLHDCLMTQSETEGFILKQKANSVKHLSKTLVLCLRDARLKMESGNSLRSSFLLSDSQFLINALLFPL